MHNPQTEPTCCILKEYYSDYTNLVDSLHIAPRCIIQKRPLQRNNSYGLTLIVRNNGLYPRLIKITTDSPSDTSFNISQYEQNRYLETDKVLTVKICIRSTTSKDINRRRHIFIHSFHPNIIFQVPIIVLHELNEASISDTIVFPSTVPSDKSYYEMIVYNPGTATIKLNYRSTYNGLTLKYFDMDNVSPGDYGKLLLMFEPKKLQVYKGFFNVKVGLAPAKLVVFDYTPRSMGVYVNRGLLSFNPTKFCEEVQHRFTVCNESPHQIEMKTEFFENPGSIESDYSNSVLEDAVSMHSALMFDFDPETRSQSLIYHNEAVVHFRIEGPTTLEPMTAHELKVTFKPTELSSPFPDDIEPPYFQRVKITLCFSDSNDCIESAYIIAQGEIKAVVMEIYPNVIDFRKVYLGEEHCGTVKVLNVDGRAAKVKFVECMQADLCGLRVTPVEGFLLNPCERAEFQITFFILIPTRFSIILRFKVENGLYYNVTIKGTGQNVQLRTFPQFVEFGSIPFGVPQKRFMLLMNPLAVPITFQVQATDDGEEQPLVFNFRESSKILPITVKDPIKQLQRANEDQLCDTYLDHDEITLSAVTSDKEIELKSIQSYTVHESEYSLEFENSVMEPIPEMASNLLNNLKKNKVFDKSETDRHVIQEALKNLLDISYFNILTKHNSFIFMDWNSIPSDPKEIYCDNEIIYLRPNTGRSITILVIPNRVGFFHRSLSVRICPAASVSTTESSEEITYKTLIKSDYLCSKLLFEYNCCTPEIEWGDTVNFSDRTIYAGEEYDFNILFTNDSAIGGFLHFDVIPNEMGFRDGTWKFYIASNSQAMAKCMVTFRVLGENRLSGLIKIVGDTHPYPFHLYANVSPTMINITPNKVHRIVQVYETNRLHFYIDNISPTNTKLSMKLENNQFQSLSVSGGILAPSGQSMYTTLTSLFPDPDLYHNCIYIDLQFDNIMEVPITFLVEGVPLYFEPDIKVGFDAGHLFTDLKEAFQEKKFRHRFPIKVQNRGLRPYRVVISRLKTYTPVVKTSFCVNQAMTARFDIIPKILELPSGTSTHLEILISGYEEGEVFCDFLLDISDSKYPQRKHVFKVITKATFVECELGWDRRHLSFNYQPSNPLAEYPHIETVHIINYNNMPVECVDLEASGPFLLKELFEHTFEKRIKLSLIALERKEISIILNKATLKKMFCRQVEGKISVTACDKEQRPLLLKLVVLIPDIHILQPELILFDRGFPFDIPVQIINHGCTAASFKWKRIDVSEKLLEEDKPEDLVSEVLSQILRTLEYKVTCEENSNLTHCYQQRRCQFQEETENTNMVFDILDEIINDLDLEHKRYLIPIDDADDYFQERNEHSSTSFVQHAVVDILGQLKIEDSQELSSPSSEYCFSNRFIYFYEKTGIIEMQESHECLLHIPHIRRGHEVNTLFQLDVVGGRRQCLSVTLVNVAQKIKFQRDNIYLNVKPWYETFTCSVRVTNMTQYPLHLVVMPVETDGQDRQLTHGHAKIIQNEHLDLEPFDTATVNLKGILGLSETFQRTFGVLINSSSCSYFSLRGHGVMPILNVVSTLPMIQQSMTDILDEYSFIRRIYNYDTFKSITEAVADSNSHHGEENLLEDSLMMDFSAFSDTDEDMSTTRERTHDFQLFQIIRSYVLINNNQELPNAIVLNQMLVAERYLHQLTMNPHLYEFHQKIYDKYICERKTPNYKLSLKHFAVQPLPCEQLAHIVDLGLLSLASIKRFDLRLQFIGPGKLIAAARTVVRVPGLYLDFRVENHADKKFTYWAEQCNSPEFFDKKYRNMLERLHDADTNPRLKHAHSYDLNECASHERDPTDRDRRMVENYYNSYNPSVYPDNKHHFTLAKVHTSYHSNFSGVEFNLVGLFKPKSKYYERGQRIVDYIYIDLHMGPTLPILIKGVISA